MHGLPGIAELAHMLANILSRKNCMPLEGIKFLERCCLLERDCTDWIKNQCDGDTQHIPAFFKDGCTDPESDTEDGILPDYPTLGHIPKSRDILLQRYKLMHVYCCSVTIAQRWKQPKSHPLIKKIRKMCYIYAMGCYSTVKKSKIIKFRDKSIKLETSMLSEINQAQKERCHSFFLISF